MCRWLSFAFVLLGACRSEPVAPVQGSATGPRTLCNLEDRRIDESSGVAPSRFAPGEYFTHNDSGDSARFFRFNPKSGKVLEYRVPNARNVDWEDMASAEIDGKPYLFFGDIGDNGRKRKSIAVYRVPEPSEGVSTIEADRKYDLHYPDRAHNAETLIVRPTTGDIYIVQKVDEGPSGVYKLTRPDASGSYALRKIGTVDVGGIMPSSHLITGGTISPDERQIVLRTYMGAYRFDVPEADFDGWTRVKPRFIKTNVEAQGESITFSLDGRRLVTTSEGTPCQVSEIPLR